MSWAQVECVKCGQPMGDHAGLFVEGKPWHTACHYNTLTARLAAAESAARFYAKWYDGPAEALLGEEDRRAFMWIEENGGET